MPSRLVQGSQNRAILVIRGNEYVGLIFPFCYPFQHLCLASLILDIILQQTEILGKVCTVGGNTFAQLKNAENLMAIGQPNKGGF